MSNEEAKKHFERVMHNQVVESVRRLGVFTSYGEDHFIHHIVINEVLILMEKLKLMHPESYGSAIANFRRSNDMNQRGFCANDGCFARLTPDQYGDMPENMWHLLRYECLPCAQRTVLENAAENLADQEFEKELENGD